ncbi:hypothetical protein ACSBR1_034034 [Camellia fascicularis]
MQDHEETACQKMNAVLMRILTLMHGNLWLLCQSVVSILGDAGLSHVNSLCKNGDLVKSKSQDCLNSKQRMIESYSHP